MLSPTPFLLTRFSLFSIISPQLLAYDAPCVQCFIPSIAINTHGVHDSQTLRTHRLWELLSDETLVRDGERWEHHHTPRLSQLTTRQHVVCSLLKIWKNSRMRSVLDPYAYAADEAHVIAVRVQESINQCQRPRLLFSGPSVARSTHDPSRHTHNFYNWARDATATLDCGCGRSDRVRPQLDIASGDSPHPIVIDVWLHALTWRYKRLRLKHGYRNYSFILPPTSSFYQVLFLQMSSPIANFESISDEFKEKITSLIKEQLKRIVTELAAQEKTLLSNLALLRHNHNVNDYQTTRLENIRDLEQSVKCPFRCRPFNDRVTDKVASQL